MRVGLSCRKLGLGRRQGPKTWDLEWLGRHRNDGKNGGLKVSVSEESLASGLGKLESLFE